MTERTGITVDQLFKKQEEERAAWVRSQIKRLNEAGFDWYLTMDFKVKHAYTGGIGLPIVEATREELSLGGLSTILHPQRGLLLVNYEGQVSNYTRRYISEDLFREIEQKVDETLAELQAPATVVVPLS